MHCGGRYHCRWPLTNSTSRGARFRGGGRGIRSTLLRQRGEGILWIGALSLPCTSPRTRNEQDGKCSPTGVVRAYKRSMSMKRHVRKSLGSHHRLLQARHARKMIWERTASPLSAAGTLRSHTSLEPPFLQITQCTIQLKQILLLRPQITRTARWTQINTCTDWQLCGNVKLQRPKRPRPKIGWIFCGSSEIHVIVVYMAWKMAKDSQVQVVVTFVVMGWL